MLKKSMIAMSLCGMMWAMTCQAGFLGNDQDLQFLRNINNSVDNLSSDMGGDKGALDKPQSKPANLQNRPGDLSIVALDSGNSQQAGATLAATVPEPGAFDLVALGLAILGVKSYLRRRTLERRAIINP